MPSFYCAYNTQRSGTFRVLLLVPLAFAEHYDPTNKSEANGRSFVPAKMNSKKKDTVWSNPLRFDLSWLSPIEV
jgi:hypothetical protein